MTRRDFISTIKAALKLESSDSMVNERLIYSIARPIANLLIKRESNLRRLFNSQAIFTVVKCLPMEEIPLSSCCDYVSDKVISRSKVKLPKILDNTFGLLIQYVSDVETSKAFTQTTSLRYANYLKLSSGNSKKVFYWIDDDYLYVTQPNLKRANVSLCIEGDEEIETTDCDCEDTKIDCTPAFDKDIKIPGYLIENVSAMTIDKLQRTYISMPIDRTDNDLDEASR